MNALKKIISPLLGLLLICFFPSCSRIFTAKKCTIQAATQNSRVEVYAEGQNALTQVKTDTVKNTYLYTLHKDNDQYLVINSKKGYKTQSFFIGHKGVNPIIFIDAAITAIFAAEGARSIGEGESSRGALFILASLTYFGNSIHGTMSSFPSNVNSTGLKPLPQKKAGQRYMYVDKASVNIPSDQEVFEYYRSYKKYMAKRNFSTSKLKQPLKIEETSATEELNEVLKNLGFLDTTQSIIPNVYNSVYINLEITNVKITSIAMFYKINITANYKFRNKFDNKSLYNRTITTESIWLPTADKTRGLNDALETAFIELIENNEVQKLLDMNESTFISQMEKQDTIRLAGSDRFASNIAQAVSASVTIKTSKGHGSGFFISRDGYLLTNYHVTSSDTTDLTVITHDGKKLKPLIVRTNPLYDLCLLKAEDTVATPVKLDFNIQAETGSEVYAIGTPNSEDLGQTVSRGIISGQRIFNNKRYLQTDVSVNPGNSGGCLVTRDGTFLGVITAKLVGIGTEGIGFAISPKDVQKALNISY